jgi:hypothetical protein
MMNISDKMILESGGNCRCLTGEADPIDRGERRLQDIYMLCLRSCKFCSGVISSGSAMPHDVCLVVRNCTGKAVLSMKPELVGVCNSSQTPEKVPVHL